MTKELFDVCNNSKQFFISMESVLQLANIQHFLKYGVIE